MLLHLTEVINPLTVAAWEQELTINSEFIVALSPWASGKDYTFIRMHGIEEDFIVKDKYADIIKRIPNK